MITDDLPREALTHLQEPTGLKIAQEASAGANVPTQGPMPFHAQEWPVKGFKEGFGRLASGVRCFFGLALVVLLVLAPGCATRRGGDWYNGPAELKVHSQHGINAALANLPPQVKQPLKWKWEDWRVSVKIVEPIGYMGGRPYIISPSGERCYGYATPGSVTLPRGFWKGTLEHELAHVVLWANGIHGDHHRFPYMKP